MLFYCLFLILLSRGESETVTKILFLLFLSLFLLLFVSLPSRGAVLESQMDYCCLDAPFFFTPPADYPNIVISGNVSVFGQMVYVHPDWGTVTGIGFAAQYVDYGLNLTPLLTVRAYKSDNIYPNEANLYLWDTASYSITDTDLLEYTFNFDYEIPVYNDSVSNIWVTFQETYQDIDDSNEVLLSWMHSTDYDRYLSGEMWMYYNGSYESLDSAYNGVNFNDMVFKIYGTEYTEPTPTDTGTPIPTSAPTGIPDPDGSTVYSPQNINISQGSRGIGDINQSLAEYMTNVTGHVAILGNVSGAVFASVPSKVIDTGTYALSLAVAYFIIKGRK